MFLSVLSTVRQIVEQHVIKIGGPWPWLCAEKEKEKDLQSHWRPVLISVIVFVLIITF